MEEIGCALCGDGPTGPYKRENGWQAVQCSRCGLVFVSPRPTIEEMKALYQGQETKIDLDQHMRSRDRKTIEARRLLGMLRRHRASGRLLEVGSAAGWFLAEARRAGYDAHGLEITEQLARFSREVLGAPAIEGTLRDANLPEGSYDVVFMRNVLSHLAHPREEHEILLRLLRPGGILFFETGNVAELPPERAGELELPDHLFHFSESTIVRLLTLTGFRWLETHRFTLVSQLGPVRWLAGRLPAHARPRATLSFEMPRSRPLARALARFDALVRYELGALLPSRGRRCTLVVVAERP